MPNQEKETVRLVLEALLRKLDAESRDADETGSSVLLSEGGSSTPVIVVLGGLNSAPSYGAQLRQGDVIEAAPAKLAASDRESPAPHPGLERFPLAEIGSSVPAPKACFIEPGRPCISSGACEMRGY